MSIHHTPKFQEYFSPKLISYVLVNVTHPEKIKFCLSSHTLYGCSEEKMGMALSLMRLTYSHRVNSLFTKPAIWNYNRFNTAATLSAFSKVSRNLGGFFMSATPEIV